MPPINTDVASTGFDRINQRGIPGPAHGHPHWPYVFRRIGAISALALPFTAKSLRVMATVIRDQHMSDETIDYGNLMHDAMRGLIQNVLSDVQKSGLPGEHHFFISFDTSHADVELADWLSDRFPDDMTIVMQHWFDDLQVGEEGFAITLNFGDQPERMFIPYDAIRTFVDPSVEFGLKFETQDDDEEQAAEDDIDEAPVSELPAGVEKPAKEANEKDHEDREKDRDAEVVSLDSFRK